MDLEGQDADTYAEHDEVGECGIAPVLAWIEIASAEGFATIEDSAGIGVARFDVEDHTVVEHVVASGTDVESKGVAAVATVAHVGEMHQVHSKSGVGSERSKIGVAVVADAEAPGGHVL